MVEVGDKKTQHNRRRDSRDAQWTRRSCYQMAEMESIGSCSIPVPNTFGDEWTPMMLENARNVKAKSGKKSVHAEAESLAQMNSVTAVCAAQDALRIREIGDASSMTDRSFV